MFTAGKKFISEQEGPQEYVLILSVSSQTEAEGAFASWDQM